MNVLYENPSMNHSTIFGIEEKFDAFKIQKWFDKNWNLSFYYVGIYFVLIFTGQHFMKERKKLELRGPLFLWNVSLALFSITGTMRTFPELLTAIKRYGFNYTVCSATFFNQHKMHFWAILFMFSKVPELGDTLFIILRKQRLMFLHYYHHGTVLLFTWNTTINHSTAAHWYMVMNFTVHSLMYSYYALKVIKIPLPRLISMLITLAQLSQMVFGCFIVIWLYGTLFRGEQCYFKSEFLKISTIVYFSYFMLFLRFFYKAYLCQKPSTCATKSSVKTD